jgi:hypothetical protein
MLVLVIVVVIVVVVVGGIVIVSGIVTFMAGLRVRRLLVVFEGICRTQTRCLPGAPMRRSKKAIR